MFGLGYFFIMFFVFLIPIVLSVESLADNVVARDTLIVLASLPYVYFAVTWSLALVISVLEEKCGTEAIGKAAQILNGMKVTGFLLNLLFTIVFYIISQGLKAVHATPSTATQIFVGSLTNFCLGLVIMFWLMAYTMFYYQCKKTHEEEAELQGIVEYAKLPTAPQIGENIL
uniref:Uncharacterized protein n=1 Tax=Rhizophora mucronata TaxID=61149 RepID=A0A2P2MYK6_RHIMU